MTPSVDDEDVDDGWTEDSDASIARGYHRVPDAREAGSYIEELPVLVRERRYGKDVTELVTLRISVRQGKRGKRAHDIDAKKGT